MQGERRTDTATIPLDKAQPGDWLDVPPAGGGPPQRVQILGLLGEPNHRRLRIRWDDDSVTIHYPSGHERVIPRAEALRGA